MNGLAMRVPAKIAINALVIRVVPAKIANELPRNQGVPVKIANEWPRNEGSLHKLPMNGLAMRGSCTNCQ